MKIVCAFDSFKGCMSAQEACSAASDALKRHYPDAEIVSIPLSDGGEGMTDCIASTLHGEMQQVLVHGPLMHRVEARYLYVEKTQTAYMEMAEAAGLSLVPVKDRDPLVTTTYGVGEMILDAKQKGCKHIVLGLGGSATCDGGKGMIECLHDYLPLDIHITVACDVTNPLFGPNGAAYVFAPQKGATPEQVEILDKQLRVFAAHTVAEGFADETLSNYPGAGAAGGLGYALLAYLKAELTNGISLIMIIIDLSKRIYGADLILTGEGSSDEQTLMGKVPFGVLQEAMSQNVPVSLLSGQIKQTDTLLKAGFASVHCINADDNRDLQILMQKNIAISNLQQSVVHLVSDFIQINS